MYRLFGVYKSQIYFMRIETCFFWLPLLVEAFINSVIFPEEMGWFIIGFLVLYFSIVGHVCWTQNWFIVMWKMCSFLEMKDGKDPLRASHYCKNLLKDLLCPTFTSLSTCSDSSGGASTKLLCSIVHNFLWLCSELFNLSHPRPSKIRKLWTLVGKMNKNK